MLDRGHKEGRVGAMNSWPIDALQPGDVYVADGFGKIHDGTLIGDNLGNSIFAKSGNGVIFDGSVRDLAGLSEIQGFNAFVRGWDPTAIRDMMLVGLNTPIRIGHVTVLPGDVVLAKREGVIFIPAQFAEEVVVQSERILLRDRFGHLRLREGAYTPGQIDTRWTKTIEEDFTRWLMREQGPPGRAPRHDRGLDPGTIGPRQVSNRFSLFLIPDGTCPAHGRAISLKSGSPWAMTTTTTHSTPPMLLRRRFAHPPRHAQIGWPGRSFPGRDDACVPLEEQIAHASQNVNRNSKPSDLRITDLRIALIQGAPMRVPIIRIDTNQGLKGYGEVRDGGSPRYALMLKSRLLGENPCNVERVFKKIKQFGFHGRQGGGVSGVEMALWDLAGKAFEVPVYQMLGGRHRERIRLYADTTISRDRDEYARRMKARLDMGYTFLKMDLGINLLRGERNLITAPLGFDWPRDRMTPHPFTAVQLTNKAIERLVEYVAAVREAIGYEVPLATDHFGHFSVNDAIRLGRALTPYQLAWLEDMVPWQYTELWKQITSDVDLPTLTGEDIYLKEAFIKLIDAHAVDLVHPDLASAGGSSRPRRSAITPRTTASAWPCTSPARRSPSWPTSIARPRPRT